jgi:tetratricopeptide (TPR) repeat protein
MPDFIQSAYAWFMEMDLKDQIGVVSGIMGTFGITAFGWLKFLKKKDIEKLSPANHLLNSGLQNQGMLTISSTGSGTTQVNTGTQITQHYSAELFLEMKRLGIAETAINNFLKILQQTAIPPEDWDAKLRQIAEDYQRLRQQAKAIQTNSIQSDTLKTQAEQAVEQGEFDQAEQLFQAIYNLNMQTAKQNILFAAEADAANGTLARTRFQYVKSGEYYQRAAQALITLGKDHELQAAHYLNEAAYGFQEGGIYTLTTLFLYEQSFNIYKRILSKEHPDAIYLLNNIAGLHELMGNHDLARPFYAQAFSMSKKILGKTHPTFAILLDNLAKFYFTQKKYIKALVLYKKSLNISENILGKNHPTVAKTLNNLAELYRIENKYTQALFLYERILAIDKVTIGKQHPDTAITLNNLALLYVQIGNTAKALPLYHQSLAITEQLLGKNHPDVAMTLYNLGFLYADIKNYKKSITCLNRSLMIRKEKLGKEHPDTKATQKSLAIVLQALNQS